MLSNRIAHEHAVALTSDPITSHLAARHVRRPRCEDLVLQALSHRTYPITQRDLVKLVRAICSSRSVPPPSDSSIRTRCRELVDRGLVIQAGEKSGPYRMETLWILTEEAREWA